MTTQTLTIGKRRFVLLPEREFLRLRERAGELEIRPEFAAKVMRELKEYRKTGKGRKWSDIKRKLGL